MAGSCALVFKGATTRSLVAASVVTGAFLFLPESRTPEGGVKGEEDRPTHGVDVGCLGDELRSTQSIPLAFWLLSVGIREIN